MVYKALLLLLPALAYSQVIMGVLSEYGYHDLNMNDLSAHFGIEDVISDTERRTWNITDEQLKDVIHNCGWSRPDDVYVKSPTPWGDLYKKYKHQNVQEVHRILIPLPPQFTGIRYKRVLLAIKHIYNDKNITVNYNVSKMYHDVEETLSTDWRKDGELSINKDISYEFNLRKWNLPDFSFTGTFGKNAEISKTATVVADSVTVELKPREVGAAALIASSGTVEMYVGYQAYLSGNVTVNYANNKVKDSNFYYFPDINVIFNDCKAGKLRSSVYPGLKIKLVFYADAKIAVFNNWRWTYNSIHQIDKLISKRINF